MQQITNICLILTLCLIVLPCQSQHYYWGNPVNIRSLNSSKDDFAPSWNNFEKRLYFSSTRNGKSKLFITNIIDSVTFAAPSELKDPLNKTQGNLSYVVFLSETEAIINAFRIGRRQSFLNIFYSQRRTGSWQRPSPLDSLECECFVLHPSVSPDGRTIVFASDMNQEGNLDLYTANLKQDGSWGEVTNLVDINTDGNEITPFFASQDTLYFASDGYGGPGGFDLFFSVRREGYWTKPIPLSEINTRFNESDFIVLPNGLSMFASDRPEGLGGLDLYLAFKVLNKSVAENQATELVLSISAQVPSVRVMREFEYDLFEIPSSIPEMYVNEANAFSELYNDTQIEPNAENIYRHIYSIYLNRLTKTKSNLIIAFDTNNYKLREKIDSVVNEFYEKFPNLRSNISFAFRDGQEIAFLSSDSLLFEPLQLGRENFSFEPSQLDITLNAIPNDMVSSWEFGVAGMFATYVDSTLPASHSIQLEPQKFDEVYLRNKLGDTLSLHLFARDTLGRHYSQTYSIILNKSYRSLQRSYQYKNKLYQKVYLFNLNKDFRQWQSFRMLFNRISEFKDYIKSFVILPGDNLEKEVIDEFVQFLRLTFQLSPDKIAIETFPTTKSIEELKPNAKSLTLLIERR